MKLELGTFPVDEVVFADETRLAGARLEIDRDDLEDLARSEAGVCRASIDIARPGERARVINFVDLLEFKVKVRGPGVVYPGVYGRPAAAVGSGATFRLKGVALMICLDGSNQPDRRRNGTGAAQGQNGRTGNSAGRSPGRFIDMSGPGLLPPYDRLSLICLTLQLEPGLGPEGTQTAVYSAALRVIDRLAETTASLHPPDTEVFSFDDDHSSLPGIVFVPHLASAEWQSPLGPRSVLGPSIYGQTRLSAPWHLYPTEVIDGAVFGTYGLGRPETWHLSNNPTVMELSRRHGKTLDFLGCIVQRTNWTLQSEKELTAQRAALLAKRLGASGAIVTTNYRGQRFLETALTVQALERAGIATVLLTEEEDNEDGAAPPLLVSVPEMASVVSAGTGELDQAFPPVERVFGALAPEATWYDELPPVHGRYGVAYVPDYYGLGYRSLEDY